MNGRGTFYFEDGSQYAGMFKDELEHGHGVWKDLLGNKYTGNWNRGVREGNGTHKFFYGDKFVGEWRKNKMYKGKMTTNDGKTKPTHESGYFFKDKCTGEAEPPSDEDIYDDAGEVDIMAVIDKLWIQFDDDGSGFLSRDEAKDFVNEALYGKSEGEDGLDDDAFN